MSRVKLGDVAREHKETIKGDKSNYPIVGLEHLIPENIRLTQWDYNKENTFTKVFRKGCVLFGRRRAYLKKAAYADFDGICSGDITVIEAIPGKILPELLPFVIQNNDLFDYAVGKSAGSLSPRVKWEHLKNYEFELPDIERQHELVKILWSIVETKESYERLMAATDELVKSQFIELAKCQKGSTKLSYYLDLDIKNASKELSKESEIVYIEISSIDNSVNRVVSPSKLKFKDAPDSAKQLLRIGDVLVSLVRPNLRKIAINTIAGDNVVGTSGFCVLRSNEKATKEFLRSVVLSDEFTEKMISLSTGSTYPTIKTDNVLDYPVPLLEMDDIDSFSDLVRQSDKSKFELENCIKNAVSMYKKILKKYLG